MSDHDDGGLSGMEKAVMLAELEHLRKMQQRLEAENQRLQQEVARLTSAQQEETAQPAPRPEETKEARPPKQAGGFIEADTCISEAPPVDGADDKALNERPTSFLFPDEEGQDEPQNTNVVTLDEIMAEACLDREKSD